jgi:hypothetical protein
MADRSHKQWDDLTHDLVSESASHAPSGSHNAPFRCGSPQICAKIFIITSGNETNYRFAAVVVFVFVVVVFVVVVFVVVVVVVVVCDFLFVCSVLVFGLLV